MSDARKKRKQERDGDSSSSPINRKFLTGGGIVALFVAVWIGGWYYKNHKYDNFAKCIATKDARMYGLYWCPHCIEQKELFGESFHYVPYTECAIKGSSEMAAPCKIAGVKLFPSWQFAGEQPKEGVLSLEALSDKTGCTLP
jgi:hypothetical protein